MIDRDRELMLEFMEGLSFAVAAISNGLHPTERLKTLAEIETIAADPGTPKGTRFALERVAARMKEYVIFKPHSPAP